MGLFGRARSLRGTPCREPALSAQGGGGFPPRGSLLRKSRQYASEGPAPKTPPGEAAAPAALLELSDGLLSDVDGLEQGLEAPARLFSLLVEGLGLRKAALLLFDPLRLVYAPWAAAGFDETTLRRLRFSPGSSTILGRLAAGETLLYSGRGELQDLRAFFSVREFAALQSLLLLPFIHDHRMVGLLLAVPPAGCLAERRLDGLGALTGRGGRALYRARERYLEAVRRAQPEKADSLREGVLAAADSCRARGRKLLLVQLCLRKVVGEVLQRDPPLDAFRLQEDITRIILSLFQPLGAVFRTGPQTLLVVVSGMEVPDVELLLHHVRASLKTLLPELAAHEPIDLQAQTRVLSGDGQEALTGLAELV
jgi:hypothetical protein